jgi:asparagine synthase (glutamine-hydrolysing)
MMKMTNEINSMTTTEQTTAARAPFSVCETRLPLSNWFECRGKKDDNKTAPESRQSAKPIMSNFFTVLSDSPQTFSNDFGGFDFQFANLKCAGRITLYNRDEIARLLNEKPEDVCDDGELLLRFYAQEGINAFEKIRGMFAVTIYDGESFLLVRDAVGARTLFYTRAKNSWAVSSSLKSLRRWSEFEAKLNLNAVRSFLTFAYLPGDETLFENVYELLPAHAVRLYSDGRSELFNYYEPQEKPVAETTEEYIALLRHTLEDATILRLPNENDNVGVFLSGGVDSSLVTALAARFHRSTVHTFSISFGAELPNETAYSSLVAAHCRTNHHILSFNGRQIAEHLAEAVGQLDCPVGDPLTVPNLLLARAAARQGLRVILNGEGGDPCFGGPKNLPLLIWELQRQNGASLPRAYLASYRKRYDDLPFLLSYDVQNALRNASPLERHVEPFLKSPRFSSYLNRLLYTNTRTKLAHHILPKVEKLTSSCGVEGRAPLADKNVVDLAFAIPPELKLRGTIEKWILKEAVRDLLPATIIDRPKSGMRVPVQQWLHQSLRPLANDLLLGKRARSRGLFQPEIIRQWMRGEGSVYAKQGGKLWLLLTLELWLRAFYDDE